MKRELTSNRKLVQRFVKDYNLPINLYDYSHFEYYAKLYSEDNGFFPIDAWNNLEKTIEERFDSNVDKWLDYCQSVRDNAIADIKSSKGYKDFISDDMSFYRFGSHNIGEHSCYSERTDRNIFFSVDLRKANFQALKYADVLTDDTYENFIFRVGGDDYIKQSKYLRQVIFGNCNPGRQTTIEKYLINKVYIYLVGTYITSMFDAFSLNSDEVVYKMIPGYDYLNIVKDTAKSKKEEIERWVKDDSNLDVRVDFFQVKKLYITNKNNDNVDAYVKRSLVDGTETLKKASTTFFPQIYKLWKNLPITDMDKEFFFEHQIATFNDKLVINDIIDN